MCIIVKYNAIRNACNTITLFYFNTITAASFYIIVFSFYSK